MSAYLRDCLLVRLFVRPSVRLSACLFESRHLEFEFEFEPEQNTQSATENNARGRPGDAPAREQRALVCAHFVIAPAPASASEQRTGER